MFDVFLPKEHEKHLKATHGDLRFRVGLKREISKRKRHKRGTVKRVRLPKVIDCPGNRGISTLHLFCLGLKKNTGNIWFFFVCLKQERKKRLINSKENHILTCITCKKARISYMEKYNFKIKFRIVLKAQTVKFLQNVFVVKYNIPTYLNYICLHFVLCYLNKCFSLKNMHAVLFLTEKQQWLWRK